MRIRLCVVVLAGLAAGCRTAEPFDAARRDDVANAIIAQWPQASRIAAAGLLGKYGPPDALAADALAWKDKYPWKRIVLWKEPDEGTADNLEETVAYEGPPEIIAGRIGFGGPVFVADGGAALSARSSNEHINFLALNLADEIVRGARTPEQARAFYDRTLDLSSAGKNSRYMQRLLFLDRSEP
jgi:hypothetical protein